MPGTAAKELKKALAISVDVAGADTVRTCA
jgi:hypothetical protein